MAKKRRVRRKAQTVARAPVPRMMPRTVQGGVSTNVLSGAASGAKAGSALGPKGAIVGGIIGGAGSILSGAGGQNVSGLDEEDIAIAKEENEKAYQDVQDKYSEGTNVGGSTYTPAQSGYDFKKDALIKYYESKGLSQEDATARANKKLKNKKFKQIKGFRKAVKRGEIEGIDIGKKGNLRAYGKADESYNTPQDEFVDDQTGLTQEIFDAQGGMPGAYADDARAGLDYRGAIRDAMMGAIGDGGSFDAADVADIKSILDLQKMNLRNLHGQFMDSGFASSNLAANAIQNRLETTTNDALTKLYGKKADKRSQRVRDMLSSAQVLSGPETYGEYSAGSFKSPTEHGGFTGPQGAEFIADRQDTKAGYANQNADRIMGANTTPRFG